MKSELKYFLIKQKLPVIKTYKTPIWDGADIKKYGISSLYEDDGWLNEGIVVKTKNLTETTFELWDSKGHICKLTFNKNDWNESTEEYFPTFLTTKHFPIKVKYGKEWVSEFLHEGLVFNAKNHMDNYFEIHYPNGKIGEYKFFKKDWNNCVKSYSSIMDKKSVKNNVTNVTK